MMKRISTATAFVAAMITVRLIAATAADEKGQVAVSPINIGEPDSGNGKSIAYIRNEDNVYAVDVETGAINLLLPHAAALATTAVPTFSPGGGSYSSSQIVTIKSSTPGAQIYCTRDGTIPTTASPFYYGALSITSNTTIKCLAVARGYAASAVATAVFSVPSLTWPAAGTSLGTYSNGNYFPPHVLADIAVPQAVDTHWQQSPWYYLLAISGPNGRNYTGSCVVIRPDGYKVSLVCGHNLPVGRNLITLKAVDAISSVTGIFYLDVTN